MHAQSNTPSNTNTIAAQVSVRKPYDYALDYALLDNKLEIVNPNDNKMVEVITTPDRARAVLADARFRWNTTQLISSIVE